MRYLSAALSVGSLLLLPLLLGPHPSFAAPQSHPSPSPRQHFLTLQGSQYQRACPEQDPTLAVCHLLFLPSETGARSSLTPHQVPGGLTAAQIQAAYVIPTGAGAGTTVAVVDAYDHPAAESDLAKYRATSGLPPCTSANGCFRKVNQAGLPSPLPAYDNGWAMEIATDIQMVSAACPLCNILLVEANSSAFSDLFVAVRTAVRLGATVVANSYGAPDLATVRLADASVYTQPGVSFFASSGDGGYGVSFPASLSTVFAVGGTILTPSTNDRGWTESAWPGSGCGCTANVTKPPYQRDPGCRTRTVVDLSALADNVRVVFNGGAATVAGTSVATPIVAAIFALAGRGAQTPAWPYANPDKVLDIVTGAVTVTGQPVAGTCNPAYLCNAQVGYDGPTGMGSPYPVSLPSRATGCLSTTLYGDCSTLTLGNFLAVVSSASAVPTYAIVVVSWDCTTGLFIFTVLGTSTTSAAAAVVAIQDASKRGALPVVTAATCTPVSGTGITTATTTTNILGTVTTTITTTTTTTTGTSDLQSSSSNPALLGLLALIAIPVIIILVVLIVVWHRRSARAKAAAGGTPFYPHPSSGFPTTLCVPGTVPQSQGGGTRPNFYQLPPLSSAPMGVPV